jgi:cytochrome c oxidase assembly protein Cox11
MLGFSYASVPLYQLYCQATGLGGLSTISDNNILNNKEVEIESVNKSNLDNETENSQEILKNSSTCEKKALTIQFNSETSDNMP